MAAAFGDLGKFTALVLSRPCVRQLSLLSPSSSATLLPLSLICLENSSANFTEDKAWG